MDTRRSRNALLAGALLGGSLMPAAPASLVAAAPHLFIVTSDMREGGTARMEIESPWEAKPGVGPAGVEATVRTFFGRHYVVNRFEGTVQVIDPATLDTIHTFSVGAGSEPMDILLVDPQRAYVTRYAEALLYEVDPATGDLLDTVDLGPLADEDGIPDMVMMAREGDRLFVQLQNLEWRTSDPIRTAYLAVVDVTTNELVDADPATPGVQGIALVGTMPRYKMQVDPDARRLFVCAPGPRLDDSGGIEEVDLDGLRSLGFILPESAPSADLGPFVMTSPDAGYTVFQTDIAPSSHLISFDRSGITSGEIYLAFQFIRSLVLDPETGLLFYPDSDPPETGIVVIDTVTDTVLTPRPVSTGLPPWDLVVYRGPGPGEARDLRVEARDGGTGAILLSYRPACETTGHNLVYGPLEGVGRYAYGGVECGIGTDGSYPWLPPGEGSLFFLVVGTSGGIEGSYGEANGAERPEMTNDAGCPFVQDLSAPCG